VGGVFNRAEFFTVGDALTQALSSEENATAGGQIIVSGPAWSLVHRYFESQELSDDHSGKKFYKIQGMIQGIRTRADAVLLRNLIQTDNFSKIQSKLRACVPAAIMPYLELGYEQFGSETRRLTVMFASLGIDLSSAKSKEGMNKI
jgi:adenylate cyclase 10